MTALVLHNGATEYLLDGLPFLRVEPLWQPRQTLFDAGSELTYLTPAGREEPAPSSIRPIDQLALACGELRFCGGDSVAEGEIS